jgi:hypothetical protein
VLKRDEDTTAFYLDRIRFDVFRQRRAHGLAITDIKLPLMQRAFNLVPFKKAIAEPGIPVRADIVGREYLSIDLIQGNALSFKVNADYIFLGYGVYR